MRKNGIAQCAEGCRQSAFSVKISIYNTDILCEKIMKIKPHGKPVRFWCLTEGFVVKHGGIN